MHRVNKICKLMRLMQFTLKKKNTHTHTAFLTIVELAVALLTVDDIKTVRDVCHHITDFKVKPLGVLGTVSIRIQYEVIFTSEQEKRRKKDTAALVLSVLDSVLLILFSVRSMLK